MILLIDCDSLVFASCLVSKKENREEKHYTDIEDSIAKFEEQYFKIVNDLEEDYEIDKIYNFNYSQGNFRKLITKKYKANRNAELPPLLNDMHNFVREHYDGLYGYGIETDDLVARYWKELSDEYGRDNVMIVSIDKDYKQFPCLMYNYHFKHREVYNISEYQALYNFYEQMIIGDTADNVNYCKGYGKKFSEKYLKDCKTQYQFTKAIYELFKKIHRGKAKQRYIECYNLLKLRTE